MKKYLSNYVLAGISAVGLLLSLLLIQKYFGGSGAAQALCDALSESGSCSKVSESSYSAIRNVPFLGDLPVALFGFIFYGFLTYLFITAEKNKDTEADSIRLSFFLLAFAMLVDLSLLLVSIFLIEAICGLCVFTYFVTGGLLLITYLRMDQMEDRSFGAAFKTVKAQFSNYLIVVLVLLFVGLLIGRLSGDSLVEGERSGAGSIQKQIADYENSPELQIDLKDVPIQGDPNAPITIVKYADFNCGHCMHTSHILKEILRDYEGIVRVAYKNFPLDGNCNRLIERKSPEASSCVAAIASICANQQKKFPAVYNGLYHDNEMGVMHTPVTVLKLAEASGLNIGSFKACMNSPVVREQINREVDEAERLRIHSTPSLFINNRAIKSGTPNPEFLRQLIEKLIKKV
ncbi:protein-disulfide isomerase [Leptospira perolatii]|uniref:Protein-disulfide isomerase n=1 Tax=Leptospira perolatii TaxID=2023191 RepID=A0A2M9ZRI0_9LEPT|nr:thioredoxin domain-containing protein [Leptospira perolatii]PJZ71103.1 protein-disulfide isomerase [Leptospira perolatii]PJZ74635.1 protein-disulfide isomerase [Leptospira perolatii]